MRICKTRYFQRWMDRTELRDAVLRKAVQEMAAGLIDAADLLQLSAAHLDAAVADGVLLEITDD